MEMKSQGSARPTALDLCVRHNDVDLLPTDRTNCRQCNKRSHWYCSACIAPTIDDSLIPAVKLPIRVDVLRGREEKDSKSTATHMAIIAKEDTRIWRLPDFPEYKDPKKVLLLYPSPTSIPASSIDFSMYEALIVVDTTWTKASGVMQLPELAQPFQHVHLGEYHTLFWRYQSLGPACLSTIEALYFFFRDALIGKNSRELGIPRKEYLLEQGEEKEGSADEEEKKGGGEQVGKEGDGDYDKETTENTIGTGAEAAEGGAGEAGERETDNTEGASGQPDKEANAPVAPKTDPDADLYDGRYDNLLYFFLAQYRRIQFEYTAGKKKGRNFNRKMRDNYIKDGSSSEDGSRNSRRPVKEQQRRARVRGGWSVRTDVMSEDVAQVHSRINARFLEHGKNKKRKTLEEVNEMAETAGSDVDVGQLAAFKVLSEQRHKYGERLGGTPKGAKEEEAEETVGQRKEEPNGSAQ